MKNLAIFYGGKSVEHDISIITAVQVMKNVDLKKYKLYPIYITNDGDWIMPDKFLDVNIYTPIPKGKILVKGFYNGSILYKCKFGFKAHKKIDIAINCMHGLNGEDGTISGLLELNDIPCVGSGVLASAVGMDKVVQKDVLMNNNIPVAKYMFITEIDYAINEEIFINKIEEKIGYPVVVKPANLGSSIGINISKNREELQKNIKIALNFDKKVIIEEQILNLREINCSVIGNYKQQEVSILEEPKNWQTFLDFDEKYLKAGTNKKQIDVSLGADLDDKIKSLSKEVFNILGCCGIARIDFLLNDETKQIYVNEINTIPGSFANYLWKHKYTFTELIDKLIGYSVEEYEYKKMHNYTFRSEVLKNFSGNKNIVKYSK